MCCSCNLLRFKNHLLVCLLSRCIHQDAFSSTFQNAASTLHSVFNAHIHVSIRNKRFGHSPLPHTSSAVMSAHSRSRLYCTGRDLEGWLTHPQRHPFPFLLPSDSQSMHLDAPPQCSGTGGYQLLCISRILQSLSTLCCPPHCN